ncbi:MAG: hypothetical protein AAFP79_16280 [Pseudomonadota bacterium]
MKRLTHFFALALLVLANSANAQGLPDSAWDEALQTRRACEGEIAVEQTRELFLGTGKVLCEDLAKRWEKSIAAQFGAKTAELYAPLIMTDVLVTAGYQYNQIDPRRKVSAAYRQKEREFGCSLLEPAHKKLEAYRTPVPYSTKGHVFTDGTMLRIYSELRFCGDRQKAMMKDIQSSAFHKAAGSAQIECAKNAKAEASARIDMCKAGMERIRALLRSRPDPTVLERNSVYLWQAHAFITMLEVKHQNGRASEACNELRGFDSFTTWLALPASGAQRFLLRNITKRSKALEQSCA